MSFELPADWTQQSLAAVCQPIGGVQTGPFGSQLHASDYVEDGIPSIMPVNIADGRVIEEGIVRITEQDAERLSRYLVRAGDIVYSRRGDVTRCALITDSEDGWLCGTGCLRARPDLAKVEPRFLLAHLSSPPTRAWIRGMAVGTSMPNLNTQILGSVPLVVPPLAEQRRIAGLLGALAHKIDHLGGIGERAEHLMTALFERMVTETDWPSTTVSDCFTIVMGQSPKGSTYTSDRENALPLVQGMGAFGQRFPETDVYTTAPTKRAQPGDVLLTVRAPVGEVNIVREELCAGRGVAAIRSEHPAYAEQVMRSLRSSWAAQESGTIFPAVNGKQIAQMLVFKPSASRVEEYEASARPLYDLAHLVEQQASRLRALRDELLPKLISGKLRVADDYLAEAAPVTVG